MSPVTNGKHLCLMSVFFLSLLLLIKFKKRHLKKNVALLKLKNGCVAQLISGVHTHYTIDRIEKPCGQTLIICKITWNVYVKNRQENRQRQN